MLVGEPTKEVTPTAEVVRARARLVEELDRADRAIRAAMGHADEMFTPDGYRGPERRRVPR